MHARIINNEIIPCFLCTSKCSYDDHWRFTWSLISGSVGLVEVRASWPEHLH